MSKILALANAKDGVITFSNRATFEAQLKELKGHVLFTVEECDERLQRMWAYYYAVIVPFAAEYHGYTENEMHEAFKLEFNPVHLLDKRTGEERTTGGTTTRKSKSWQWQFVQDCIRHCDENGIALPPPTVDMRPARESNG